MSEQPSGVDVKRLRPIVAQVELRTCPYLGFEGDEQSSALYPRADHICTHDRRSSPSLEWQANYCVTACYEHCPHFRPAVAPTTPKPAVTDSPARRRTLQLAASVGVAVMLAAGMVGTHSLLTREAVAESGPVEPISQPADDHPDLQETAPTPTPAIAQSGAGTHSASPAAPSADPVP